jgi:hypothetical protein
LLVNIILIDFLLKIFIVIIFSAFILFINTKLLLETINSCRCLFIFQKVTCHPLIPFFRFFLNIHSEFQINSIYNDVSRITQLIVYFSFTFRFVYENKSYTYVFSTINYQCENSKAFIPFVLFCSNHRFVQKKNRYAQQFF